MARKRREKKRKLGPLQIALIAISVVAGGAYLAFEFLGRSSGDWGLLRAWYVETDQGAVVVVERGDYTEARHSSEPRYSVSASASVALHSHRVDDGGYLGSFAGEPDTVGVWHDRLWVDAAKQPGRPFLLSVLDMSVVADRAAILAAVGSELGGDFQPSGLSYRAHPYTGELQLQGARGNEHLLSTELKLRPAADAGPIPPEGYSCVAQAADLIEPSLAACLPAESAPALAPARSHATAIKKDRPQDKPLISAVQKEGRGYTALWTKSLTELTGSQDAFLSGTQLLDPHRVVLLVASDKVLHLVFIDPSSGAILEQKRMFGAESPPGPGTK